MHSIRHWTPFVPIMHLGQISEGLAFSSHQPAHPLPAFTPSTFSLPALLSAVVLPPRPPGEDTLSPIFTHFPRLSSPLELGALGPHTALQEALNSSPRFLKACPGVKLQRFLFLCHFPSLLLLILAPPTFSGHTVSREVGVHEDHCSSRAVSGPPNSRQFLRAISYPPLREMISVNCLVGISYRWGRLSPHAHPGP